MKTILKKAPKVIIFIVAVFFAYALLDMLYLFALNNRYQNLGDNIVLDKWTERVFYADEYDGLNKLRTEKYKSFEPPFWRIGK